MRIFRVPSKRNVGRNFTILSFIIFFSPSLFSRIYAQNCSFNIDFETGTFNGWTCYTGSVASSGGVNILTLYPSNGPVADRHVMYGPNAGMDPYGGFPINCPNGSGHSIRLGNALGGSQAEGISYEFTIPANRNTYSLVYHYAVVFQDPHHEEHQQPRMKIEITNATDNNIISCSSFSFYPYSTLPGFVVSSRPVEDAQVLYKNWSAVSVNLDGLAGKTIRLFFKTSDCTFSNHFGYAYIDIDSDCTKQFDGAAFCTDDTLVNITAPYGYHYYTWYNNNFTQVIANQQTVSFSPAPPAGTKLAVIVIPFTGYGCVDTFYTILKDTLTIAANAGPDAVFCTKPVALGATPIQNVVYHWSPSKGLNNEQSASPLASPDTTTTYILSIQHSGGGCKNTDTVTIHSVKGDHPLLLDGSSDYCLGSGDSSVLMVNGADSIQWIRNGLSINGANQSSLRVTQTGLFQALVFSQGCSVQTETKQITIGQPEPGIVYPVKYAIKNSPLTLEARPLGRSVLWSPQNFLDNPVSYRPLFTGSTDQNYTITFKSNQGCITVDTLEVKIAERSGIFIPSAFTPDNDGLNDILKPVLIGMKSLHYFRVFNRWGKILFETHNVDTGWDGNVKGRKQETQVVVWIAAGEGIDGHLYVKKGTSLLIR